MLGQKRFDPVAAIVPPSGAGALQVAPRLSEKLAKIWTDVGFCAVVAAVVGAAVLGNRTVPRPLCLPVVTTAMRGWSLIVPRLEPTGASRRIELMSATFAGALNVAPPSSERATRMS